MRFGDAAGEESGGNQQHEGERRLQGDQAVAQPPASLSGFHPGRVALQIGDEIRSVARRAGREARDEARGNRDEGGEQQHAAVDAERQARSGSESAAASPRRAAAGPLPARFRSTAPIRPSTTLSVSSWRISRPAACTDREPDPDLALTAGGACQQHVRDVRARDQQHETDTEHQRRRDRTQRRVGLRMNPDVCRHLDRTLLVGLRVGLRPAAP